MSNTQKQKVTPETDVEIKLVDAQSDAALEQAKKEIDAKAKEFTDALNSLNSIDEQKIYIDEVLKNNGINNYNSEEFLNDAKKLEEGFLKPSEIIPSLGMRIVEEQVKNLAVEYPLADLVGLRDVENGISLKFFKDYLNADNKSGRTDIVIKDFNPDGSLSTEEVYRTNKDIHKGFRVLPTVINDISKSAANFLAVIVDIPLNIARPIAKYIYQLRLQTLVNPFAAMEATLLEPIAYEADKTIEVNDLLGGILEIKNMIKRLKVPSRKHVINSKMIPLGFKEQLERQVATPKIIVPTEFKNAIDVNVKAGLFNQENADLGGSMVDMPYDLSFEDYGKVTGLNYKDGKYSLILVEPKVFNIIRHYQATKYSNGTLPNLFETINTYERLGIEINKEKFWMRIDIIVNKKETE